MHGEIDVQEVHMKQWPQSGCRGTLDKLPSCCKQHVIRIWWIAASGWTIPGHQKHSHNKDKVQMVALMTCIPMAPVQGSATQWALGTMNSRRSSVLSLGIECRYKAPWWIVKFCWFCKISQPSWLEVCSARSTFKSVFFCNSSQFRTALQQWVLSLSFSPISHMHLH